MVFRSTAPLPEDQQRYMRRMLYYSFELFEDDIHNINKNSYINLHMYTEAKNEFILAEEQKDSKMNKIS